LSSSEGKGLNKIKMFDSGEIPLMKEVGLAPIFYGRTIAGLNMPCLVYMTCGENLDRTQATLEGILRVSRLETVDGAIRNTRTMCPASSASCSSAPPPRKSESCLRQVRRVFRVTEDALIREMDSLAPPHPAPAFIGFLCEMSRPR